MLAKADIRFEIDVLFTSLCAKTVVAIILYNVKRISDKSAWKRQTFIKWMSQNVFSWPRYYFS